MKRLHILILVLLVLCVLVSSFPVLAQYSSVLVREGDALWEKRIDKKNAKAAIVLYKKVLEADADNYEANWKIARSYFFLGDMLPETKEMKDRHKEMGTEGMRYAGRALELNPQKIEGHYYYALCLGQYSIGISIIKALAKGLGPDYEEHISKALEIDKQYDYAGPLRAMGRYWYKLPWPKRDIEKSVNYLKEAVVFAPMSIRGRLYLAESYLKAKERELAKEQLQKALEIVPDFKIEVDAKRWKERARMLLEDKL